MKNGAKFETFEKVSNQNKPNSRTERETKNSVENQLAAYSENKKKAENLRAGFENGMERALGGATEWD